MSGTATLNSRIRVLIAKIFRAEKLYSSMRVGNGAGGSPQISEIANEIRAQEWQRSHRKFRSELNELVSEAKSGEVVAQIVGLRDELKRLIIASSSALSKTMEEMQATTGRQEFVHSMKLSVELIRLKARYQANSMLAAELDHVLQASGKAHFSSGSAEKSKAHSKSSVETLEDGRQEPEYSNVIHLNTKVVGR